MNDAAITDETASRKSWREQVERAKRIAEQCAKLASSPAGAMLPGELRAILGDLPALLVELALCHHAKFDMSPTDFPELARQHAGLLKRVYAIEQELEQWRKK